MLNLRCIILYRFHIISKINIFKKGFHFKTRIIFRNEDKFHEMQKYISYLTICYSRRRNHSMLMKESLYTIVISIYRQIEKKKGSNPLQKSPPDWNMNKSFVVFTSKYIFQSVYWCFDSYRPPINHCTIIIFFFKLSVFNMSDIIREINLQASLQLSWNFTLIKAYICLHVFTR